MLRWDTRTVNTSSSTDMVAAGYVNSNASVIGFSFYKASQKIVLNKGFKVPLGSAFAAWQENICNGYNISKFKVINY